MRRRLGGLLARHADSRLVNVARGLVRTVQFAPQIARGPAMLRVVWAGVAFGLGRRRPMTLRLTAPRGPLSFTVPDYAALRVFAEVFLLREYEVDIDPPPRTILDLGANIGVSVLYFRRRFPEARIIAVEASPGLAELLRENTRTLDVEVRAAAVALAPGTVMFHESAESWAGTTSSTAGVGAIAVPAIGFDDLLRETRPDLVKLDVEGAELEFLPASRELCEVPYVIGEIHAAPESRRCAEALRALSGFRITTSPPGPRERFTVFEAVAKHR
jgi:FkbM family methyltransferase